MTKFPKFIKLEPAIFLLVVVYSLIPIIAYKFFPTNDGPAHLYNAMLLKSLIIEKNEFLNQYFILNSVTLPNWLDHFSIALLSTILPIYISEKIILILYVFGFSYGFRNLILTIAPNNVFFTYIIFPFIYSFFLFLGFYNFIIAIVFLFITIGLWIKFEEKGFTLKRGAILFFLFLITYYSHLFSFLWLVFFIAIYITLEFIVAAAKGNISSKESFQLYLKKILVLASSSIVPLIMVLFYFKSNPTFQNKIYLNSSELVEWIKNLRPIIALNVQFEEAYSKKLFYLIMFLISIVVYNKISKIKTFGNSLKSIFLSFIDVKDTWLIAALILVFLYLKLPDSDGGIGLVSIRLCYFFFIFLVIWICIQRLPKWLGFFTGVLALYFHFNLNQFYLKEVQILNITAEETYNAASLITDNSVVLPLNWSNNWLHSHFSNYLGINKPIVILENYEATLNWFPLKWNDLQIPAMSLGDTLISNDSCYNWARTGLVNTKIVKIDYVFILGDYEYSNDSCRKKITYKLNAYYKLIYKTQYCRLYMIN